MTHASDSIVIIPTYNEKENIEKIIRAVFGLETAAPGPDQRPGKSFHILVIDDGSPDGTAAIVKGLMATEFGDRLFLLERSGKLGLGTAYITGFKWALEHDYEYVFEMDADFSHDPNDLPRLYSACADEGNDVAIGSRYVSGVNVVNWPMGRVLMSYFASKYVRCVTGFKIHDTTAGFVCYRRRVLETIELDKVRFKGYGFQIEMKFTAYRIGFRIKEVPVIFVNRREGTSKMSGGIFGEAFFGVMRLRWDGWTRKYPKIKQLLLLAGLACCLGTEAADITITPDSSLADAVRKAREMRRLGQASEVTIRLAPGTYRLYEPLRLRPEDSGLTIEGRGATISGGMAVTGWKREGKLLVADVPDFNGRPVDFRQLWTGGQKAVRARDVSDFERMYRILTYDKKQRVLWVPKEAVAKIAGSRYPELVLHEMWCTSNLRIKSITVRGDSAALTFHDPEAKLQFEHPWPSPMTPDTQHPSPFYLTNAKELLDEPGEWYHDVRGQKVYYIPRANEASRMKDEGWAVVPVIETLVEFVGTADRPVRNITFRGITFSHTTWMRPSQQGHVPLQAGMYLLEAYKLRPQIDRVNNHKLDNQGWLGRADAAVELRHAENCDFDGCRFEHLGGSGLDYVTGCRGGATTRCTFSDIAMNGYVSGSFSPEGLETHLPYQPTDFREVCTRQEVRNCLFHDVTNEDWGCVAIAAGYVSGITIAHNTIHDVSYTGISLGWGWNRDLVCMKDNRVEANLIYNYAQHMYDCAGIYTLGNQPGTVIAENVVRDIAKPSYVHDPNHWFYLYTDEGSSNITLKDNWTPEEKFLKNANGPGNVWENNGPQVSDAIKHRAGVEPEGNEKQ